MMKNYLALFFLLSLSLYAQKLSLNEAIEKALKTHPDIQTSRLSVSQSHTIVEIADADYLPQINLNAEYNPTKTYVFPANGVFNTKESDGWQIGVALQQKIWDFSKTTSNVNAQKESVAMAKLSLQDTKAYLAYKVKLVYELIIVDKAAIQVRTKDLESKDALYKQSLALVKEGMKTSADASRFLSAYYIAEDNLALAKANYDKARNNLSLYITQKLSSDIELDKYEDKDFFGVSEEDILKDALSLQILQREIKKSNYIYKSVEASHYGSIDAIASYSHQDTLNEYDAQLIGVTLNVPIYSGGRVSAQVQEAELNRQILQSTYNSKILAIQEEIESLLIDIKRYDKTIKSKKDSIYFNYK